MISFLNVNIDCNSKDVLHVYNDDRNFLLYDYCLHSKQSKYVMARSKYLIVRMITSSPKPLSASFDTILVDAPINSLIEAAKPPVFLTNSFPPHPISTFTTRMTTTTTTTSTTTRSTTKGRNFNGKEKDLSNHIIKPLCFDLNILLFRAILSIPTKNSHRCIWCYHISTF